jgi:hypothetical protein
MSLGHSGQRTINGEQTNLKIPKNEILSRALISHKIPNAQRRSDPAGKMSEAKR